MSQKQKSQRKISCHVFMVSLLATTIKVLKEKNRKLKQSSFVMGKKRITVLLYPPFP